MQRFLPIALLLSFIAAGCSNASGDPSRPAQAARDAAPRTPAIAETGAAGDGAPTPGDAAATLDADATAASDGGQVVADAEPDPMTLDGSLSTSIGGPADGQIKGAIPFPKRAPGFRLNPRRLNKNGHFGTVETVQAILRAAAVVEREIPGGHPLTVNDACFEAGGPMPHHGSHQSGRDLDVLFYLFDREGDPRPAKGVPLDPRGRGTDFADLAIAEDDLPVKFDPQRSWRFLQALAEDENSRLQRVFVAEHLRTILLREARRVKAPRAVRRRIEEVTCQPGSPHDDHFHIRFFCAAEDIAEGCEDSPWIYPWRREQLAKLGLRPVINRPRRRRRRAKTVSAAAARAKAGKMHWKVHAFLRQRQEWREQPHPGRVYCR